MNAHHTSPVFFDPTQRRATHLRLAGILLALLIAVALTVFWFSVVATPVVRVFRLNAPRYLPDNPRRSGNTTLPTQTTNPRHAARTPIVPRGTDGAVAGRAAGVVGAFFVNWDETSLASLRIHAPELTHLFPGWLHLNGDGSDLVYDDHDPSDREARRLARENNLKILPLVNNFSANRNDFDEKRLHELLTSPEKQAKVTAALLDYCVKNNYRGINLDLETENDEDRELLADFTETVAKAFHPRGLLVTSCTQVDDPEQTADIARSCDFIVPMIYDLHWATGDDGPIAPEKWAEEQLTGLLKEVPADKVALAIGNYAYDWVKGKPGAKTLTFGEAMVTAQESHDGSDGVVRFDKESGNPTFTYEEENGERHTVWMLDAVTAWNFQRFALSKGVSGRALWYIGSEDPTVWTFFGKTGNFKLPSALESVRYGFEIDFEGEGEVLDVMAMPQPGSRTLTVDKGAITDESFTAYPTACVVRRSGKQPKRIAFTFDDGPDPLWTPGVLDALKSVKAPATFFVCGVNAQEHPDLLKRMWAEGHEIGNHSFYHPNFGQIPQARVVMELNATQRAIQAATLRSTTLFRPPYGIDSQPSTAEEIAPVNEARKLGYVTVAEGLDPRDWEGHPTPEQIAGRVVQDAESGQGNIVLLHDSGGNREATIKAIPLIVNRLRTLGYKFVPVSDLMGVSRDAAMPKVMGRELGMALLDRAVFMASSTVGRTLAVLFIFSLVVGTLRLVIVGILAWRQAQKETAEGVINAYDLLSALPTVSVVIAAYNEEKVITRTIEALLDGNYPHLEVIVVDDGSKDDTGGIVERTFACEPRVRLIRKENGGKASALNLGIAEATGEILVGLDADTLFAQDTVHRLVRHFTDPTVGAVAGNIQVGNRVNLLTRFQAVEYTASQNLDRRAYSLLNALMVVPGCVGAWRRSAVVESGGYQTDTLAEDTDLTWRVRKAGWRTLTDNSALAFTEAPERYKDLIKQRFRWTFGTLQVLWKHRRMLFNPRYGWLGLAVAPSVWIFQMIMPLVAPFADLGILSALLTGHWQTVAGYAAAFIVVEYLAMRLAFLLEGASPSRVSDLRFFLLQRIVYRYMLFHVLAKSIVTALQGARAGWGKLDRRGTAQTGIAAKPAASAPVSEVAGS